MDPELIKKLNRYDAIAGEAALAEKYGEDYSIDKGTAADYLDKLHPSRILMKASEIIEETSDAKTLRLTAPDRVLPPFLAGQYIVVFLTVNGVQTSRPYSLSSPPNQIGFYDITIRRVENGLVSNYLLDEVKAGDVIECSGPQGYFYHNPLVHSDNIVCIAGGSGITPFMSMVRETVECGIDRTINLFYGNKNADNIIFHDEFVKMADAHDNIRYYPVIEEPPKDFACRKGFIDGPLLKEVLGPLDDRTFFICGPQGMYEFCLPQLTKLGVPGKRTKKEMFGAPISISLHDGWPRNVNEEDEVRVTIAGGKSFKAKAGTSLLVSMENEGAVVPSLCRSGECSMCRVKLVSGKVFQPQGTPVRKSDKIYGYIHSCASYPIEDIEILI